MHHTYIYIYAKIRNVEISYALLQVSIQPHNIQASYTSTLLHVK